MSHYLHGIDCDVADDGLVDEDVVGSNTAGWDGVWSWLTGGGNRSMESSSTSQAPNAAAVKFNMRQRQPGSTGASARLAAARAQLAATQAQLRQGYAAGVTPELLVQVSPPAPSSPDPLASLARAAQQVVGAQYASDQAVLVRVTDQAGLVATKGAAGSLFNKFIPDTLAKTQIFPTLAQQINDGFKEKGVGNFMHADVVAYAQTGKAKSFPVDVVTGMVVGAGLAVGGWQLWKRVLSPLILKRR